MLRRPTHEELRVIATRHHEWMDGYPSGRKANLSMFDLNGLTICNYFISLKSVSLRGADLTGANFGNLPISGADLRGAKFTTELVKCDRASNVRCDDWQLPWLILNLNFTRATDEMVRATDEMALRQKYRPIKW